MTLKNFPLIPKLNILLHKPFLFTLSKADFKSMKAQYNPSFSLIILLTKECNTNIASTVDLCGLKPNCASLNKSWSSITALIPLFKIPVFFSKNNLQL